MTDPREELGYTHQPTRRRTAPRTDLDILRSVEKPGAFLGVEKVEGDPPWRVTLLKKSGKHVWIFGYSEDDAVRRARGYVDLGGLEP